jgi:beta-N-acetylhexosaminidase
MRIRPVLASATAVGLLAIAVQATASAASPDPVAARLAQMTLEQKVGQLFSTYVYGDSATTTNPADVAANESAYGVDTPAEVIAKYHLGNIIYFTWSDNLNNPTQIATLSNGLQQAGLDSDGTPLLISTDQEGGNVVRIGAPLAVSPGNMAIGATFSAPDSYAMSQASGQQLKALGINVDDAPVVDVNTNPDNTADGPRSFGDLAGHVAAMAAASVSGYQNAGIAATAKHFPGLGSTSVNTDTGIAITDETKAQFQQNDLPPFRAAISSGVDVVMAAHIVAKSLDPSGAPASMSEPIVTGLLRGELHYNGVVITDALSAAALQNIAPAQRAVDAIKAGDDVLLMPDNLGDAINAVLDAVHSGQISQARIDQSVTRILTLKQKLGLFTNPMVDVSAVPSSVGTAAQNAAAAQVATDSITLVRNQDSTLPVTPNSGKHVLITGWGASTTQTLTNLVGSYGVTAQRLYTGTTPTQSAIDAAVAAAGANDEVIVTTDNAWGNTAQQNLVKALLATGKPVTVVAMGGPYDLAYFPDAPTYLAAYGYQPATLTQLVAVLFGAQPEGHLPVTIHQADDPTKVLVPYGTGLHYSPL